MGFDNIFDHIGHIGLFQFGLFGLLWMPALFTGYENMAMIFLGPDQDHWCQVPRLANFSYDQQKYIAVPFDEEDEGYDRCHYFNLPFNNLTDADLIGWNRSSNEYTEQVKCDNGWLYDQSIFISSVVSKWDLVCSDSWKNQLIATIYLMGMLVGAAASGALSDRYGRKTTLVGMTVTFFTLAVICPYIENYYLFAVLRLLVAANGHGTYLCAFVMVMEVIGPKYRTKAGMLFQIGFSTGFCILPFMAYFVRDFIQLQLVMAGPILVSFAYIFVIPESPRWLLSQGRNDEAEKIIRNICSVNNRPQPANMNETVEEKKEEVPKGKYSDLFRYPILRKEILIVYFNWFTNNLLYYGFSLNTGTLTGSLYMNTLLSAMVELPARVISLIMLEKWGRRWCVGISELTSAVSSGICMILIIIDNDNLSWMLTLFTMIGKMGITSSFSGIYVFTAELFPTPIRHLAVGSSSMMSRVSGLMAPFMGAPMMAIWAPLPSLVFGLFALVAGSTVFMLPETIGTKLPDTIEEAENIGRKKKKKSSTDIPEAKIYENKGFEADSVKQNEKSPSPDSEKQNGYQMHQEHDGKQNGNQMHQEHDGKQNGYQMHKEHDGKQNGFHIYNEKENGLKDHPSETQLAHDTRL